MTKGKPIATQAELQALLELTRRVGNDPLLTHASTGNSSAKLDGMLWIKASGKWMADALSEDILIPLDLTKIVKDCLRPGVDPAEQYPNASLETAMHAAIPHPVVLHVHCVSTIAWAVRKDGPVQLQRLLDGLRWQWIPYAPSGLPLSRKIEQALCVRPATNVFVLANHGLVVSGNDAKSVEDLLADVSRRVAIPAREAPPADETALRQLARDLSWSLPDDPAVHALGTDPVAHTILGGGLLYPCQAIFSESRTAELFRPIPLGGAGYDGQCRYSNRPFLIIDGCGVLVRKSIAPADRAMLSGLARVIQRLSASDPLRYLTKGEIDDIPSQVAYRYRELADRRDIMPA